MRTRRTKYIACNDDFSRKLRVSEVRRSKEAPVGSEEWARMRQSEDKPASSSKVIQLSCSSGSWSHFNQTGFSCKANLSSSSHLAASVHHGAERLFATAHDILEIRTATGQKLVRSNIFLRV